MMLRLHKLASEPQLFDPIEFHSGLNLILGERSETDDTLHGRKVNGVGKTMCVEFLHFSLLRNYKDTRVSKIPNSVLPSDLVVTLDITISDKRYQIRRSIEDPARPSIVTPEAIISFENLTDATEFLGENLFANALFGGQVSYRALMSLLMRDESSGFDDILNPYSRNVRPNISPHLFLMGIDLSLFQQLEKTIESLASQRRLLSQVKKTITEGGERKINDIPLLLNEERRASEKIEDALQSLRADPAFEAVEEDLADIENDLIELRGQRKALSFQIDQIRSIPLPERIDSNDLKIVFDRVKEGLGDQVVKSVNDVQRFKDRLENFQKSLREKELGQMIDRRKKLSRSIANLSSRHSELTKQIDQKGSLSELRVGLEIANQRTSEYKNLDAKYSEYENIKSEIDELVNERSNLLFGFQKLIKETYEDVEDSLNVTLSSFHERIMGNSAASFKFVFNEKSNSKQPVSIDCRIEDDGSQSINKERTFLYDFTLLLDSHSKENHPGILMHDNILEVDQDTTYRCLNFVNSEYEKGIDFQYILTLNRDKIESEEARSEINFDIDQAQVASFTKDKQFLGVRYSET